MKVVTVLLLCSIILFEIVHVVTIIRMLKNAIDESYQNDNDMDDWLKKNRKIK